MAGRPGTARTRRPVGFVDADNVGGADACGRPPARPRPRGRSAPWPGRPTWRRAPTGAPAGRRRCARRAGPPRAALVAEADFTRAGGRARHRGAARPPARHRRPVRGVRPHGPRRPRRPAGGRAAGSPSDVAWSASTTASWRATADPPLTTVRQPIEQLGAEMARLLLAQLDDGRAADRGRAAHRAGRAQLELSPGCRDRSAARASSRRRPSRVWRRAAAAALGEVVGDADGGEREDRRRQQRQAAGHPHEHERVRRRHHHRQHRGTASSVGVHAQGDDPAGADAGDDAGDRVAGQADTGMPTSSARPMARTTAPDGRGCSDMKASTTNTNGISARPNATAAAGFGPVRRRRSPRRPARPAATRTPAPAPASPPVIARHFRCGDSG